MAGVRDSGLFKTGTYPKGINNVADEGDMPKDEFGKRPIALREADNVDFDRVGNPRRRRGQARFFNGTLTHSLWSHDDLPFGLFVDDGVLHSLDAELQAQDLGVDVGGLPVSYALIGGRVYWSNAMLCGMLTPTLQPRAWSPEQPAGQPAAAAIPGFGLPKGTYQVAITFSDVLGRESGTGVAVVVEVPDDYGIELTAIPQPVDSNHTINIYLSDANDQGLRLHSTVFAGVTTFQLAQQARGILLATQMLVNMPAGHIVRGWNGRHLVARGNELFWSPVLRHGLMDPLRNRVIFTHKVDMMEPIGGGTGAAGVFVGVGQRTVWLDGSDPNKFSQRIVNSAGVVPHSSMTVSGSVFGYDSPDPVVIWLSRKGHYCVGHAGGKVDVLKLGEAVVDSAQSAAVMLRQEKGIQQIVTSLRGARQQGFAIRDHAVAHIIHTPP